MKKFPHISPVHSLCGPTFFSVSDFILFGAIPQHVDESNHVNTNTTLSPLFAQLIPQGNYLLTSKKLDLPAAITPKTLSTHLIFSAPWEAAFIAEHDLAPTFIVHEATLSSASSTLSSTSTTSKPKSKSKSKASRLHNIVQELKKLEEAYKQDRRSDSIMAAAMQLREEWRELYNPIYANKTIEQMHLYVQMAPWLAEITYRNI